jgi:hypothetical protein
LGCKQSSGQAEDPSMRLRCNPERKLDSHGNKIVGSGEKVREEMEKMGTLICPHFFRRLSPLGIKFRSNIKQPTHLISHKKANTPRYRCKQDGSGVFLSDKWNSGC